MARVALPPMHQVRFRSAVAEQFSPATRIAVLVTTEFEGVFKNGGVGTYYKNLATRLHQEGWMVILVLGMRGADFVGSSPFPEVRHIFSLTQMNATLELSPLQQTMLANAKVTGLGMESLGCLFYVQAIAQQFPEARIFVEFHEMLGLGYDTIQARQAGMLPENCRIGLTMHSGHEWIYQANERFLPDCANWFEWVVESERLSFEQADLSFHPSQFLKHEVETYHWQTTHAILMPNYISVLPEADAPGFGHT